MSTLSLFDRPGADDDEPERPAPLRVAQVNRSVRANLEGAFRDVWVVGEVSEVMRAASGHVYFTLSDEEEPAQLRAVMFRSDARRAKARIERGAVVRVRGQLTLFEPRGTFQMLVRIALPAGSGDLHAHFERTRKKLEAEGLLDPARKRALPRAPRCVGVVTSIQGAAMHDIVRVAAARLPVRIVVADCRVQGQEAPASIVAALRAIQRLPEVEVVIVGRGGGSQEDLWAFNHESVARAVAACRVPTVSAVGHEVDVTITDLVADVRAATPSNAAEIVVPDRRALGQELDAFERRLVRALDTRIGRSRLALERLGRALSDPRHAVSGARAELEGLAARLERAMARGIAAWRRGLAASATRLARLDPRARLARDKSQHADLAKRLERAAADALGRRRDRLGRMLARLDALSPLAVLARGYAIALHVETGRALVRASDARAGDSVTVRLHEGSIEASVVAVRTEPE